MLLIVFTGSKSKANAGVENFMVSILSYIYQCYRALKAAASLSCCTYF